MAEPIGALRVDLSASAAQFEADMGKARATVNSFGASVKSTMGGFAASVAGAAKSIVSMRGALVAAAGVGGLGLLIKGAIAAADDIAKMADRTGLGIEALQELSYAANLAGIDNEKFGKVMERLNTAIGEAASGTLTYKQAFESAGIAVRGANGELLQSEDAFLQLADAIGKTSDATARANIVYGIFGQRLGTSLLPLFKDGAEGIARLRQEARDLGVVLDAVMVREAEKSGDQLERLGKILSTNLTRTLLSLTPQILSLSEAMINYLRPAVQWLISNLPDATAPADELRKRIGGLEEEFKKLTGVEFSDTLKELSTMPFGFSPMSLLSPDMPERVRIIVTELERLNKVLKYREKKEAIVKLGVEGDGVKVIDELERKREQALEKHIKKLEDAAALEALFGAQKTLQNELINAGNLLLDEQGKKTRDLTDAEKERIANSVRLAETNKQETTLKKHLIDLERANLDAVTELGVQGEIRRAILQAQNLLIDEQGIKTRDLTAAEAERIANTVRSNALIDRESQLKKHIYDLNKRNQDTVIGIGVAEEIKRAKIEAQNLLIDEQGVKLRNLTEAEELHIENAITKQAQLKQLQDTYSELESFGTRAFDRIGDSVTKMFVEGKASALDFQNVINGILSEIMQEFIKLAVVNPIKNAIFGSLAPTFRSLFAPSGGAGAPAGSFRAAQDIGFATGGSFKVGGAFGTDRNLVQFRASRGEMVEIKTPGQQGEYDNDNSAPVTVGGNTTVNVYAPPGTKAETRESQGPGGRVIDVILDEMVAKNIGTPGSRTAKAIKSTFAGVSPALQGR